MPLNPAQRHQIEQDAITAAQQGERLAACDDEHGYFQRACDRYGHSRVLQFATFDSSSRRNTILVAINRICQ